MTAAKRPRRIRDWLVDFALFALAVVWGIVLSGLRISAAEVPSVVPAWLFTLDQAVGALGCGALWFRRRWPTEVAVALVLLSSFSEMVSGAMLVGLFTVAVHRPPRTSLTVFALSLLAAVAYALLRPEPGAPGLLLFFIGAACQGTATGWGLFVHHRRRLLVSLRERAEAEARRAAREEIAREIHDVLGHRLSLLSVHAGALAYRPDAPPQDIARAARVIRESAHQALQDLRQVVGVLRAPVGELPQPVFADLRSLVAEAEQSGMRIRLVQEVAGEVPDALGRTVYRIVQEAVTNVRKHAPGAAVTVAVNGAAGTGLDVAVTNTAPTALAKSGQAPGPGYGLLGLAERVRVADGELEYGPLADGGWRLTARLPWPS